MRRRFFNFAMVWCPAGVRLSADCFKDVGRPQGSSIIQAESASTRYHASASTDSDYLAPKNWREKRTGPWIARSEKQNAIGARLDRPTLGFQNAARCTTATRLERSSSRAERSATPGARRPAHDSARGRCMTTSDKPPDA